MYLLPLAVVDVWLQLGKPWQAPYQKSALDLTYVFSDRDASRSPTTTNLSLNIPSCNFPYEQCTAKQNTSVIKWSTIQSCNCLCEINFAHSNVAFIIDKVTFKLIFHLQKLFWSISLSPMEDRMLSTLSTIVKISLLTWFSCPFLSSPDGWWKHLNRLIHLSKLSGLKYFWWWNSEHSH